MIFRASNNIIVGDTNISNIYNMILNISQKFKHIRHHKYYYHNFEKREKKSKEKEKPDQTKIQNVVGWGVTTVTIVFRISN